MYLVLHKQLFYSSTLVTVHVCISFIWARFYRWRYISIEKKTCKFFFIGGGRSPPHPSPPPPPPPPRDRPLSVTWWEADSLERLAAELYRDDVTAGDRVQYDEATDCRTDGDEPSRRLERNRHARLLFTDRPLQHNISYISVQRRIRYKMSSEFRLSWFVITHCVEIQNKLLVSDVSRKHRICRKLNQIKNQICRKLVVLW